MTVVGISMVKDEADIIATTVLHMLYHCDFVLVADNMSSDGTRRILDHLAADEKCLYVVDDFEPAYTQSDKMSALARRAHDRFGAEWIVPFDADEIWHPNPLTGHERIATLLEERTGVFDLITASLYDHVATPLDGHGASAPFAMCWRRPNPAKLPKVAVRYADSLVIEMGNHGAHWFEERAMLTSVFTFSQLIVRHFPYRSPEQVISKIRNGSAAYKAAGDLVPEIYGAHWRQWGQILDSKGEEAIRQLFFYWHYRRTPRTTEMVGTELQPALVFDPAPVR